jgi:subtilisin family serine protease
MDWIASAYDVLNVHAGNQGEMLPIPTDNFNGMAIGRSSKVGSVYRQVSAGNTYDEDAEGDRTSISLIAPGDNVELTAAGGGEVFQNGTSFAVPHVVGTGALLHQYAEDRIATVGAPRWNATAVRHEVMKAVLINSADKLIDNGTVMVNGSPVPQGGLLGMERTVIDQNGDDWLTSEAYGDGLQEGGGPTPLDDQMGAGHLNARRASQQFAPGEYLSDSAEVPAIGWDYGNTTGDKISQSIRSLVSCLRITLFRSLLHGTAKFHST